MSINLSSLSFSNARPIIHGNNTRSIDTWATCSTTAAWAGCFVSASSSTLRSTGSGPFRNGVLMYTPSRWNGLMPSVRNEHFVADLLKSFWKTRTAARLRKAINSCASSRVGMTSTLMPPVSARSRMTTCAHVLRGRFLSSLSGSSHGPSSRSTTEMRTRSSDFWPKLSPSSRPRTRMKRIGSPSSMIAAMRSRTRTRISFFARVQIDMSLIPDSRLAADRRSGRICDPPLNE